MPSLGSTPNPSFSSLFICLFLCWIHPIHKKLSKPSCKAAEVLKKTPYMQAELQLTWFGVIPQNQQLQLWKKSNDSSCTTPHCHSWNEDIKNIHPSQPHPIQHRCMRNINGSSHRSEIGVFILNLVGTYTLSLEYHKHSLSWNHLVSDLAIAFHCHSKHCITGGPWALILPLEWEEQGRVYQCWASSWCRYISTIKVDPLSLHYIAVILN